jgi:Zn-dependent protease
VHTEALQRLAQEAQAAASARDVPGELSAWRKALDLLPPQSRQHGAITEKLKQLAASGAHEAAAPQAAKGSGWKASLGGLTAAGLILWKFKAVALFAVTKLKFLLLGLTKAQTLLSMLFAMGVYFTLWGWKFAVGFVISMYVHEMGHVAALRKHGIAASAPMFIPGLGAYVRMHQYPSSPAEDARVGLAGPIWGLFAALFCLVVYMATGEPIWGALAKSGAYLNLFNLLPVWSLDGARGFHALGKRERIYVVCALIGAWMMTQEGLLIVIALVAAYRAFATPPAPESDRRTLYEFVGLVIALSFLMHMHVPV